MKPKTKKTKKPVKVKFLQNLAAAAAM